MTVNTETNTENEIEAALAQFYADLDAKDLQPLWTQVRNLMTSHPLPNTRPWLWQWQTLYALAQRAGELVTIERGGERRVLALSNPGLNGWPFASSTLWGAIQYLNPHEKDPAHRHSPGAIRFVLQGQGTWTTVNGDACDMHPGDLILTPSWTWHDHYNHSDGPMVWFDGLDHPTLIALDAVFFEHHPQTSQAVQPPHNISEYQFGKGLLPVGYHSTTPHSPLLVYRWAETDQALDRLLQLQGGPIASLQFVDPTTGRAVMPTLGCEMHRIVAGGHTQTYRKVGSSIFVVYQGQGYSVINGQRFDWGQGDMFVVPSWASLEHIAQGQADLFAVTDRPTLEALALFREEYLEQPQAITSRFEPK